VVHVTSNFQAEAPLSKRTLGVLQDAFAQGWNDPLKLSQSAAKSRILRSECIESTAQILGVLPQEIEVLGEPNLGHFLALSGLLYERTNLAYSSVDRKEVHALAHTLSHRLELPVDHLGFIDATQTEKIPEGSIFALQGANAETGVIQKVDYLVEAAKGAAIACDYSTTGARVKLPQRWNTAVFDSKAWQGPQGLGFVVIRENSGWHNPLPRINSARTPQSFSLPLLMASTVALEEWVDTATFEYQHIRSLTSEFRRIIVSQVENSDVAGDESNSTGHITSLSFLYVEGEELLRELDKRGFSVDSGSACTAEDLMPSHVLSAMGILTQGNIRVTFHHGTSREKVLALADAVVSSVNLLRAN